MSFRVWVFSSLSRRWLHVHDFPDAVKAQSFRLRWRSTGMCTAVEKPSAGEILIVPGDTTISFNGPGGSTVIRGAKPDTQYFIDPFDPRRVVEMPEHMREAQL